MLYHAYEMTHAAISPMRAAARMSQEVFSNPLNPMTLTIGSRAMSAALQMFINVTKRYGKPVFGLESTLVDGVETPVVEEVVWSAPFCNLIHFRRDFAAAAARNDPKVLVVAPMSGHYATLLRGTVRDMLPDHDIYITDWLDAREVPVGDRRLRPRRLYRLPDRDDRGALGRGRAHRGDGRLPAGHPGDGGGEPDVDGRQSAAPGLDDPDGLADGHRPQPQAAERVRLGEAAVAGSRTTSSCGCPGPTRASCARSIPASSSSRASWR